MRRIHAVLAACLYWADAQRRLQDDQLAALLSRIRFPAVRPSVLMNYCRVFRSMDRFDPCGELVQRAVSWGRGETGAGAA